MANKRLPNPRGADEQEETSRVSRQPGISVSLFVELLSGISEQLINIPAQHIGREIPRVLRRVVESFRLDRATVWEIAEDRHGFRIAHSLSVEDTEELPRGDVGDLFPYLSRKALDGELVRWSNLRDLPPEASHDRATLERFGQRSLLLFPFRVGGSYVGAVSYGTAQRGCRWSDRLVDKLHQISRSIATTLARKQAYRAIEASRGRLAEIERIVELGTFELGIPSRAVTGSRQLYRIFDIDLRAELESDALLARIHADDRDRLQHSLAALRQGRDDVEPLGVYRLVRGNGELRYVQYWAELVRDSDERPYQLLGVVQDVTDRRRSEEELRQLSSRLLRAQEEERARIARELHDDLSQRMALLNLEIDILAQSASDERVESELARLSGLVGDLAASVRKMSHALHPSALQHLGLVAAVDQLRREIARLHGLDIEFEHLDMPDRLKDEAALGLYRIAQEALRNVVKHSQSDSASVRLCRRDDWIELAVSDRGAGFEQDADGREPGLGMLGMRERLRLVRGRLTVHSRPGRGTTVTAAIPVAENLRPPTHEFPVAFANSAAAEQFSLSEEEAT